MIGPESSNADILEEMRRIRVLYTLKTTLRYQTTRDHSVHSESVAEHLFAMEIIAQYFLPLEDPKSSLDRTRIHELILFHELGEIETGDIVFHQKNDDHREEERRAAERIAKKLPASLQALALDRVREFDEGQTAEAKFADAIDKIEPIFEMFDESVLPAFRRLHITREMAVGNKRLATGDFPYMRKFLDAWEERAVSLDIFPA